MSTHTPELARSTPSLYEVACQTPLINTDLILSGARILLKDETVQPVGSFKLRGAYHAARLLDPCQLEAGIVTASAGNHGQGVAFAAKVLNCASYVYVPETTPRTKLAALRELGAKVVEVAGTVDDALIEAQDYARASSAAFIHPFDNPTVIDGQSSLVHEILDDCRPDNIFVPVGGGGLLAGACRAVSDRKAHATVYGVQLEGASAFADSLRTGEYVCLDTVNALSDGTAVRSAGKLALQEVASNTSFGGIIVVSNAELGEAMVLQETLTGIEAEPAGSLSFAGMFAYAAKFKGNDEVWAGVISGKHRDHARYQKLAAAAGYPVASSAVEK